MTIEAELPDGTILEFPDGTDQTIIQNAVRSQLGIVQPTQPAAQPVTTDAKEPEGFTGASFIEPLATALTSIAAEPIAGLAGIVVGPEAVATTREALTFEPRTEAGREGLETLGTLAQFGIDVVNIPLSGLAGIVELVSGQGVEQAAKTIKAIQGQGLGKALGERAFEVTGSPLAATIAETLPTAALSLAPLKGTGKTAPTITADRAGDIAQTVAAGEALGVPVLTSDIFKPRSVLGKLSQQFSERIPAVGVGGKRAQQQTARVNALERLRTELFPTSTKSSLPSKSNALPCKPPTQSVDGFMLVNVPVLLFTEISANLLPAFSLNNQQPTSPLANG